MVVHDMRHPATSIKMGLQTTTIELRDLLVIHKDWTIFEKKCKELIDKTSKYIDWIRTQPLQPSSRMVDNDSDLEIGS